jgi:hypothetical protein
MLFCTFTGAASRKLTTLAADADELSKRIEATELCAEQMHKLEAIFGQDASVSFT